MSKFSSRLARYNTINCEQVMPVPVIPVCAISCCIPVPICEVGPPPPAPIVVPPTPCNPPQSAIDAAPIQTTFKAMKLNNYSPLAPTPPAGTILTNTTSSLPAGYLLCDGSEISRAAYSAIFSVIGTYYGDGDGVTTFNLPNLSVENAAYVLTYIIKI